MRQISTNYMLSMVFAVLGSLLSITVVMANEPMPIILDKAYNHDRFITQPQDKVREFRAYTVSFDSSDDNDGDGIGDALRIPEWVAYEVKRFTGKCIPRQDEITWFTDQELSEMGIAPESNSYEYPEDWHKDHPQWYIKGQLAVNFLAQRIGNVAAHNTYSLINTVPQRKRFNIGMWRDLEYLTGAWAQRYGSVWVITGPVVLDGLPSGWVGEEGDMRVAIPDAFFKIIVRVSKKSKKPEALAFLYPQFPPLYPSHGPYSQQDYLVSVDDIEKLTGLDFFTALPEATQTDIESKRREWLWPVKTKNFVKACEE